MSKSRIAVVFATGTLAALGIAGTALADNGADDPKPHSSASVSASPSASPSVSASTGVGVSVDAAKRIAVQAAGGGFVESVERELEHGRQVWDVDVIVNGVEHDIDVDALSGTVTRHRIKGTSGKASKNASPTASATTRGGDDRGGRGTEAGDDNGGARDRDNRVEPGDDRDNRTAEPGDDNGGGTEKGDDKGGHASEKGDDHGGEGHGSDD